MQFDSFADFIAMGGYGFYVWLCFGFSIALLVGLTVYSKRQTREIERMVADAAHREQRIKQSKEADLL